MTWAQVFDADEDAVVKLTVLTCEEGQITGSGFLVEPDVVVTAAMSSQAPVPYLCRLPATMSSRPWS